GRRASRALAGPRRYRTPKRTGIPNAEANGQGLKVQTRHPGFPHAMALRLIRALPGERRFLPPLPCQNRPTGIDATVAAPGPHDFAVRSFAVVAHEKYALHCSVHRIPARRNVTIARY